MKANCIMTRCSITELYDKYDKYFEMQGTTVIKTKKIN